MFLFIFLIDNENNRIKDSFEFSIQIPAPEIDYDLIENTVFRQWIRPSRRPWGWWWLTTTKVPTTERSTVSTTKRSTTSRSTRLTTRRTTRATTSRSTTIRTSRSTTRKGTTFVQDNPTSKRTTYSHSRPTNTIRTTTKRRTTTTLKPIDDIYDYVNFYDWVTKDGIAMNLNEIG